MSLRDDFVLSAVFLLLGSNLALGGGSGESSKASPRGTNGANVAAPASVDNKRVPLFCVNAFPNRIRARIEADQRRAAHAGTHIGGPSAAMVIAITNTWNKSPVTVSFNGGNQQLHEQVAEAMMVWTQFGRIKLDFGRDPATGEYRKWSPNFTVYKSDVRISFDHPEGGYWSLIGTDSRKASIVGPGEASLNLQGFVAPLSDDDKGTALHEIGHALGFQHEHQSPKAPCEDEFRWEDAGDGTPGVYTILGQPPNNWDRNKVDHNLRRLPNSRRLLVLPYDHKSIMHYSFPTWMFISGASSPCFTTRNNVLSDGDKSGIKKAYPDDQAMIDEQNRLRTAAAAKLTPTKAAAAPASLDETPKFRPNFCVNSYPTKIEARVEARDRKQRHLGGEIHGQPAFLVIAITKTWGKGTVSVSFNGGTKELHHQVADAMSDWTSYGNIKLDFGLDATTGEYRKWDPGDTSYKSDVRISFDNPEGGYWSLVGTDSVDKSIVGPGEASLNLQGFTEPLSDDDKGTALHEIGHALGMEHEHQSPLGGCDTEFRWEDAPDGTPGIYSLLGGSPNFWPRDKVDHNLRQLPNSRKLLVTPYDPKSIMHYSFPTWMFTKAEHSLCYTTRNNILSDGDKAGIKQAYPSDPEEMDRKKDLRDAGLKSLQSLEGIQTKHE